MQTGLVGEAKIVVSQEHTAEASNVEGMAPVLATPLNSAIAAVGLIWLVTLINVFGPRFACQVESVTLLAGLIPIVLVATGGRQRDDHAVGVGRDVRDRSKGLNAGFNHQVAVAVERKLFRTVVAGDYHLVHHAF